MGALRRRRRRRPKNRSGEISEVAVEWLTASLAGKARGFRSGEPLSQGLCTPVHCREGRLRRNAEASDRSMRGGSLWLCSYVVLTINLSAPASNADTRSRSPLHRHSSHAGDGRHPKNRIRPVAVHRAPSADDMKRAATRTESTPVPRLAATTPFERDARGFATWADRRARACNACRRYARAGFNFVAGSELLHLSNAASPGATAAIAIVEEIMRRMATLRCATLRADRLRLHVGA